MAAKAHSPRGECDGDEQGRDRKFSEATRREVSAPAAEVSALVDPELARLDAVADLTFSNLSVVDDRTREQSRFREPAYDISLGVTNGSAHTIARISGHLIFRNDAGEIIDTSIWIFSDRDVPAGLHPGETFSSVSGVRIENLDAEVATVEVLVSDITIR